MQQVLPTSSIPSILSFQSFGVVRLFRLFRDPPDRPPAARFRQKSQVF